MSHATHLVCTDSSCGREFPLDAVPSESERSEPDFRPWSTYQCEWCFHPLESAYHYDAIAESIAKGARRSVEAARRNLDENPFTLQYFAPLLPGVDPKVDLGVGFSPLVRADRLAEELGLGEVWLKKETRNPTNSFKDRVTTLGLSRAVALGFKTAACASTGNLANSVAAHAAHAGLRSYVFIPSNLEAGKVVTTSVYGGNVVAINGTYDDVNELCGRLVHEYPWAFVNVNMRPFYAEGSKTLAYETVRQLEWEVPDHVVVPVASGSQLKKIHKAFGELHKVGLLHEEPQVRISGAQAAGCSPVANAFFEGRSDIRPVTPDTIAKSLAIGNPRDGYFASDIVRDTGGSFGAVTEGEIIEGMKLLARTEGIFGETAAGVTIATLRQLAKDGVVRPDERVVAYITGHGLKTLDAVTPTEPLRAIEPNMRAFEHAFEHTFEPQSVGVARR